MNKPIDWEQSMLATEDSARKAASLSERSITGLAEVLASQRRHSQAVAEIRKTLAEIKAQVAALPSLHLGPAPQHQTASLPAQAQGSSRHFWRWIMLAFLVGLAFGVSIGNW